MNIRLPNQYIFMTTINSASYMTILDERLNKALAQTGANTLDAKHQEMLKLELMTQLEQRLRVQSVTQLSGEALVAYGELVKSGEVSPQAQLSFFAEHIPNYQQFLTDTLEATIAEYVELAKA